MIFVTSLETRALIVPAFIVVTPLLFPFESTILSPRSIIASISGLQYPEKLRGEPQT